MEQAYGMRCHGLICYFFGVQRHVQCDCFKFVQESNPGGLMLRNTWLRIVDHYGDGGKRFHIHF